MAREISERQKSPRQRSAAPYGGNRKVNNDGLFKLNLIYHTISGVLISSPFGGIHQKPAVFFGLLRCSFPIDTRQDFRYNGSGKTFREVRHAVLIG